MKKGEIWLVELPSADEREQMGSRPALVLAETGVSIAIITPLTSNLQTLRFPHTLKINPSEKNMLNPFLLQLSFKSGLLTRKD